MAKNKTTNWTAATCHGVVYSLPFYLLGISAEAWFVIFSTHVLIDHFRLARYVVFAKNWFSNPFLKWKDCNVTGYPNDMLPWLSTLLLIIADNTLHLLINYFSIKYL
jgi:hypothetical protein